LTLPSLVEVKTFIDLVIAFYDDGSKMKVVFGPAKAGAANFQTNAQKPD
jgi:hypothetical protein